MTYAWICVEARAKSLRKFATDNASDATELYAFTLALAKNKSDIVRDFSIDRIQSNNVLCARLSLDV